MKDFIARSKKGLSGGIGAAAAALIVAWPDGISAVEIGGIVGAFVGGFALVWYTPKNAE